MHPFSVIGGIIMGKYTLEQQLELEKYYRNYAYDLFIERQQAQEERQRGASTLVAKGLVNHYAETFINGLREWTANELKPRRGVRKAYKTLLSQLVEQLGEDLALHMMAAFTFQTIITACTDMSGRSSVSTVAALLVDLLLDEANLELHMRDEKSKETRREVERAINSRVKTRYKREYAQAVTGKDSRPFDNNQEAKQQLGAELIYLYKKLTGLIDIEQYGGSTERVMASQLFLDIWRENTEHIATRMTYYTPMIVPPREWTTIHDGAYYGEMQEKHLKLIRFPFYLYKTRTLQNYLARVNELDLTPVLNAVNAIQRTPYRINTRVLEVVQTLIDQGGDVAGLERMQPYEKLPYLEEGTKEEIEAHKKKAVELIKKEISRRSRALLMLKTVGIAKDFSKYEEIYFPCNLDFRGRIYPICSFSHQGNDLMKGLVEYASPVPAKDPSDWDLLKIQGCNLWGNDKVSYAEQLQWVDENTANILAVATDPYDCTWWQQADDPIQFLAFCNEYAEALEYIKANGSIVGYKCHIVIAYDGTCSGLQHYSAMLQDPVGGAAVNLIDHERPADIYQQVADKVIVMVKNDLVNGTADEQAEKDGRVYTKWGTKTLATAWMAYGITRKVCKRPVMTLAYGSEQYGFGEQIYEDTTKDNAEFKGMPKAAARYLAAYVWQAVQKVVVAATEGMNYLKSLAAALAREDMPVMWYTPLGFPVQQPYLIREKHTYQPRLSQGVRIRLYYDTFTEREDVDKSSQVSGIAPNFIHSLDSTHLMMTVNAAKLNNYTTIHDSFGTSLGEASTLKRVIREQLYKLYTEFKPLENMHEFVEEQLGKKVNIEMPKKGNLDLQEILKSRFIFH